MTQHGDFKHADTVANLLEQDNAVSLSETGSGAGSAQAAAADF